MPDARGEAERRYTERYSGPLSAGPVRAARIYAFEAGAKWQASQSPATEDEREVQGDAKLPQNSEDEREALAHVIHLGMVLCKFNTAEDVADAILAAGFRRSQSSPDWTDAEIEAAAVALVAAEWPGCTIVHGIDRDAARAALSAASSARTTSEGGEK